MVQNNKSAWRIANKGVKDETPPIFVLLFKVMYASFEGAAHRMPLFVLSARLVYDIKSLVLTESGALAARYAYLRKSLVLQVRAFGCPGRCIKVRRTAIAEFQGVVVTKRLPAGRGIES